jgi:hypothetical protein
MAANAQSSFTQRLQKSNNGEGKVTVTQDKAIDDLVNGASERKSQATPQKQTERKESNNTTTATNQKEQDKKPEAKTVESQPNVVVVPDTIDARKKVMKGYKVSGYRVQVFAGGNSRSDRIKAEKTGSEIKSFFPGVPVYVHFYSPRWICRMGNYRTYEEALEVLTRVKNLGYQSAIIVKGKITVSYQPSDEANP